MTRSFGHLKNAVCLSLFIGFTALISPVVSLGQDKEPVSISLGNLIQDNTVYYSSGSRHYSSSYTVPQGKRLVIEQVFLEIDVPAGVKAQGSIKVATTTSWGGYGRYYPLQLINQGTDPFGATVFSTSQLMKLYVSNSATSGNTVKVSFLVHTSSTAGCTGEVHISGYLEPAP